MAEATSNPTGNLQSQFYGFFDNLSPAKKIYVVLAIVMVLGGLGLIVYNSQQETYTLFMNGMTPKETAGIVAKLDESQIRYRIQPGGTGVLVETGQLDQARIDIASSGLTGGNTVGFELFDKTDFTSTEFEQNIRYRRALEGELARLIQKIEFIDSAKVVIAIPEKSVFISEEKNPTASVQLTLKSGKSLTPKAAKTITNLVSSGIPDMKSQNVIISDQFGNLYSSNTPEDISAETRDVNLKYKTEFETYLTGKVLTQLEKIAGRGHVEVRVSADINFDESQIEENTVDPDSSTLVSEESITEASTGSRSIPVGIPGVTSNSPEIQAGSAEVANISDYSKKQKKANYENSKKYVRRKINSGSIQSVSVSVLIDDKLITRNNEQGQPVQEFVKWSDQELAQITAIAQRAVGFNDTRGDKIDVKNISFNQKKEQNQSVLSEQQYMEREFWINIIKYIFFTMVLIALIFVVVRPMVKRLFEGSDDLNLIMGLPTSVGNFEGRGSAGSGAGASAMVDDLSQYAAKVEKEDHNIEIPPRNKILELAKNDPQKTANIVKFWLKDKSR